MFSVSVYSFRYFRYYVKYVYWNVAKFIIAVTQEEEKNTNDPANKNKLSLLKSLWLLFEMFISLNKELNDII